MTTDDATRERIALDIVSFDFQPHGGSLHDVRFQDTSGETVRPLHTAPWVGSAEVLPDDLAQVERQLSGDFFCAPFGPNPGDVPIHGWTANGIWQREKAPAATQSPNTLSVTYRLAEPVAGARVSKTFTLRRGHPVLYQRHTIDGGNAHMPIAHHAMIHASGGVALSFSPKQFGVTPSTALEPDRSRGRSLLAYPQQFDKLQRVRLSSGEYVDASHYPFAAAHEDLFVLTEATPLPRLAWSAALATTDGYLFFAIKDPHTLPETILWMSNGGRNYAPWSGRHTDVLGIEEAATAFHCRGIATSSDNGVSSQGLPTGLTLSPERLQHIDYAFGAIAAPDGWTRVKNIHIADAKLIIEDSGGQTKAIPFDPTHFLNTRS